MLTLTSQEIVHQISNQLKEIKIIGDNMMDSTTAIEIVTKGQNTAVVCLAIIFMTWLYCKIKNLIFGDE